MIWLKRIGFFILINALVILTISISSQILLPMLGIRLGAGTSGLLILCALMGFSGSLISLMLSKFMAKSMYGVEIIDPQNAFGQNRILVDWVHRMAKQAGLSKMPEVGIYHSPEINAFATGPSRNNSMVAVSTGLLNSMNEDEIEGVIGHEISHIANGDMVTMTLLSGVINTFVLFLSRIIASAISNSGRSEDDSFGESASRGFSHMMIVFVLDILFTILGSIALNYFSRLREYRADKGGAHLAGRHKMIAGLQKLQRQYEMIPVDSSGVAAMKISNKSGGIMALFSTHPDLSDRIKRLQEMK